MKRILVTTSWDDGHVLDLRLAELLKKYNLHGTFYISPHNREFPQELLLNNEQIIRLSQDFEVGGHTMTHPILFSDKKIAIYRLIRSWLQKNGRRETKLVPRIPLAEARQEIKESKEYLEHLLKKDILSFCYPDGRNNAEIQSLVKEAGYIYARTVERFSFELPQNHFAAHTSLHAFRHFQDVFKILRFSHGNMFRFVENLDWLTLGKRMFDYVCTNGGLFHVWGHSWEIDMHNDWTRLEELFAYISGNPEIVYVTNGELVSQKYD